jgi:MerR family redox-sensitive transcriptional activator SoxR
MTIGELSADSGFPASTIRYWEKIGVLPKPVRSSGQRRYSQDSLDRLSVLRLAQECGFRLDEMRHLFHGFSPGIPASRRWKEIAVSKKHEIDEKISRLKAMRKLMDSVSDCRCVNLTQCGRIAASVMESTPE